MLSMCVSVCPSVPSLRYHLNFFLPPLPEVGCPKLLEIRNPWGKVMERSGLRFEIFTYKWCKIAAQFFFIYFFFTVKFRLNWSLTIKSIKSRSRGYMTRIRRLYNKDQEVISRIFFGIGATIRIGRELPCLPYAGFYSYTLCRVINEVHLLPPHKVLLSCPWGVREPGAGCPSYHPYNRPVACLCTVHCTLYTEHCTLYTVHCTVYSVHCTLCTSHCTVYTVHCTVVSVTPPCPPLPEGDRPAALRLGIGS